MGVPYETKPIVVDVPGGQRTVVKLNFPARSFVSKVVVVQVTGTNDSFDVDLYNHKDALEGTESSASSSDADGNRIPLDCYRIGSTLHGSSGKMLYFSDEATGGHGMLFFCQDEPPADRRGQSMRNLYVMISPAGTGDKSFGLCVGGESQISGV